MADEMRGPVDGSGAGATLLVVGSANADLVVRVARHPAPGETVLGGSGLAVHPGGKGANQAVAAGRLGARVAFCGLVGRDAYGDRLVAELRAAGVGTSTLRVTGDAPTGVALITVADGGENTIVVAPGANARLTAAEAEAAVTAGVRVVSAQCEVPLEAVRAAARRAPRLILNPSPPEPLAAGGPLAAEILGYADPLVLNQHELRVLLDARGLRGSDDPHGGLPDPADLLRLGVRCAVVTLGAEGAVVIEPGERKAGTAGMAGTARAGGTAGTAEAARTAEAADKAAAARAPQEPPAPHIPRITRIPAPAVEVVDTTGAGDAFTGALAWRLAEGDGLVAAARWAVRAGAAAVRESGAQLSSTACGKLLEATDE